MRGTPTAWPALILSKEIFAKGQPLALVWRIVIWVGIAIGVAALAVLGYMLLRRRSATAVLGGDGGEDGEDGGSDAPPEDGGDSPSDGEPAPISPVEAKSKAGSPVTPIPDAKPGQPTGKPQAPVPKADSGSKTG